MNPTMVYCIIVGVIGTGISVVIFFLGKWLFKHYESRYFDHPVFRDMLEMMHNHRAFQNDIARYFSETYSDYLQRRNEYWTMFGQIIIAVLIVTILSILLILKAISAEAGLPILSGISGFAIAKGVSGTKTISIPENKNRNNG